MDQSNQKTLHYPMQTYMGFHILFGHPKESIPCFVSMLGCSCTPTPHQYKSREAHDVEHKTQIRYVKYRCTDSTEPSRTFSTLHSEYMQRYKLTHRYKCRLPNVRQAHPADAAIDTSATIDPDQTSRRKICNRCKQRKKKNECVAHEGSSHFCEYNGVSNTIDKYLL